MNLCRPGAASKRGQAGWRRLRIAHVALKRTGDFRRRHRCFRKIPTLSVQARSREAATSQDKIFSVVAAERPQGNRSYGGQGHSRIAKFDLMPSPGSETPARTVGKYGREVERRPRNSPKEGPVTDCG